MNKQTIFYYVYILRSMGCNTEKHFYVGLTKNVKDRLKRHNEGLCPHTIKYRPWQIETVVAFRSFDKAVRFEKYLKSGSGRIFAKRHF